jgi:quercetin dioxygenase-like cupin family protein
MKPTAASRGSNHFMAIAGLIGALTLTTTAVHAGSCPADKVLTKPRDIGDHKDVGVKRKTLAVIDLSKWRTVGDLRLRTRRLTIPVGGVVPTHEHDDRPSIVYIVKGEIVEHSTLCSVPILHKAGEWTPEFGPGHAHWWENKGKTEVVLTSSDVVPPDQLDGPDM